MGRNSFSPDSCHWDGWFTRKAVANPIHTSRPKAPLELRVNFVRCCAWGSLHRGQVPTHGSTLPSRRCFAATWLMRHVVKSSRKLHSCLTTHPHNLSCPVLGTYLPPVVKSTCSELRPTAAGRAYGRTRPVYGLPSQPRLCFRKTFLTFI